MPRSSGRSVGRALSESEADPPILGRSLSVVTARGTHHQASHFVHTGRRIYLSTSSGLICLGQDPARKGRIPKGELIEGEPGK